MSSSPSSFNKVYPKDAPIPVVEVILDIPTGYKKDDPELVILTLLMGPWAFFEVVVYFGDEFVESYVKLLGLSNNSMLNWVVLGIPVTL